MAAGDISVDTTATSGNFITVRFGLDAKGHVLHQSIIDMHEVQDLLDARAPTPFGLRRKEVLDESCCQVSKLDAGAFCTDFYPYIAIASMSLNPSMMERQSYIRDIVNINQLLVPSL